MVTRSRPIARSGGIFVVSEVVRCLFGVVDGGVVSDGHRDRDQDRLGHPAGCAAVQRAADAHVGALEAAVEARVVGVDRLVEGASPSR